MDGHWHLVKDGALHARAQETVALSPYVMVTPQDKRLVHVVRVWLVGDRHHQDVHAAVAVKVARDDSFDDGAVDEALDPLAVDGGRSVPKILWLCKKKSGRPARSC